MDKREITNADHRATYRMLKEHRFCTRCRKQDAYTMIGRSLCYECTEKKRIQARDYRKKYREPIAERQRERRAKRTAEHKCRNCGKKLAEGYSYLHCPVCRAVMRRRYYRNAEAAGILLRSISTELGMCYLCTKEPAVLGKKLCAKCYEKSVLRVAIAREAATKKKNIMSGGKQK